MRKKAHITCRPGVSVGDEVIGLCGKVFTLETMWHDIPAKHPVCRKCIDTALIALTDADQMIEAVRIYTAMVSRRVTVLAEAMDESLIDQINDRDQEHFKAVTKRAEEEQARWEFLRTCACRWEDGVRQPNTDCPVHGEHDRAAPAVE